MSLSFPVLHLRRKDADRHPGSGTLPRRRKAAGRHSEAAHDAITIGDAIRALPPDEPAVPDTIMMRSVREEDASPEVREIWRQQRALGITPPRRPSAPRLTFSPAPVAPTVTMPAVTGTPRADAPTMFRALNTDPGTQPRPVFTPRATHPFDPSVPVRTEGQRIRETAPQAAIPDSPHGTGPQPLALRAAPDRSAFLLASRRKTAYEEKFGLITYPAIGDDAGYARLMEDMTRISGTTGTGPWAPVLTGPQAAAAEAAGAQDRPGPQLLTRVLDGLRGLRVTGGAA
jgi:hypothetical protein